MRPRLEPRNLPAFLLGVALVISVFAVAIPVMGKLAMARESDLKSVAGSVHEAPKWLRGKSSKLPIIRIRVETDDGLYNLDEQDLRHSREILALQRGDQITARVMPFLSYHNVWELKRDGVTIESYEETRQFQVATNERGLRGSLLAGLIALILVMVALVLRMRFGAWRSNAQAGLPSINGAPVPDQKS